MLILILPNGKGEDSQCNPPVANHDTGQSAPTIFWVFGFEGLLHSYVPWVREEQQSMVHAQPCMPHWVAGVRDSNNCDTTCKQALW